MNEIQTRFNDMRNKNDSPFIPFLVIGDPNPELFLEIIRTIEPYSDYIELGIPFSDPIADGPTILTANQRALKKGSNLSNSFYLIKEVRKITTKPIILLTYANILGVEPYRKETLEKFALSGINGIIVADIPIEESSELLIEAQMVGIDIIFLVTPATHEKRLREIVKKAQGFLYLVSINGITGVRNALMEETSSTIKRITSTLGINRKIPIFVGFGISQPSHIQEIISMGADGVIVGSALIKRIEENLENPKKMLIEIEKFVCCMKNSTKI